MLVLELAVPVHAAVVESEATSGFAHFYVCIVFTSDELHGEHSKLVCDVLSLVHDGAHALGFLENGKRKSLENKRSITASNRSLAPLWVLGCI